MPSLPVIFDSLSYSTKTVTIMPLDKSSLLGSMIIPYLKVTMYQGQVKAFLMIDNSIHDAIQANVLISPM